MVAAGEQLIVIDDERRQRSPSEAVLAKERFSVERRIESGAVTEEGRQRPTAQPARAWGFGQGEDGRHDVDVLHPRRHTPLCALTTGLLHDERDTQHLFVQQQAVFLLAVVAETFAVIGHQQDRRPVIQLVGLQIREESPDDLVGVGDLRVVRRLRFEACRCLVGRVRLSNVQEKKGARRSDGVEPMLGDLFRFSPVACQPAVGAAVVRNGKLVIEKREPAADAGGLSKQERRHDTAGLVAAVAQELGDCSGRRRERVSRRVTHARFEGQAPGQEGGVGRQGLRHMRVGMLEDDAVGRECVDRRSLAGFVAVRGKVVSA